MEVWAVQNFPEYQSKQLSNPSRNNVRITNETPKTLQVHHNHYMEPLKEKVLTRGGENRMKPSKTRKHIYCQHQLSLLFLWLKNVLIAYRRKLHSIGSSIDSNLGWKKLIVTWYSSEEYPEVHTVSSASKKQLSVKITFTPYFNRHLLWKQNQNSSWTSRIAEATHLWRPRKTNIKKAWQVSSFYYDVQHGPCKNVGHADELSQIPVVCEINTTQTRGSIRKSVANVFLPLSVKMEISLNHSPY